jgi:hypothetical protein
MQDAPVRIDLPLLLAASAFAAPTSAQPDPRGFVDAVTLQVEEQAARFHVPVCAASYGLPAGYGEAVVARIRDVAQAAGAEADRDPDCQPNLIVMVANDSQEVSEVLRRARPDIYAGVAAVDIDRVLATSGPVRAWQSSEPVRAEGGGSYEDRDAFIQQDVHLHNGNMPASLLRSTTRRDLRLSVVVFDVDAIDGMTLRQIADHAALRGLAPTRPPATATGATILTLFDGAGAQGAPAQLTGLDLAYLRALYRDGGASKGSVQRAALARGIEQAFSR